MTRHPPLPRPGQLLRLTRDVSVQFIDPILVTVAAVLPRSTWTGWVWLDVYQLDDTGRAVARREVWVQPAKLQYPSQPAPPRGGRR